MCLFQVFPISLCKERYSVFLYLLLDRKSYVVRDILAEDSGFTFIIVYHELLAIFLYCEHDDEELLVEVQSISIKFFFSIL